MKSKVLLLNLIVILIGCGKEEIAEEENSNHPPANFSVRVENITDTSATITWDPSEDSEKDPITYSIYLNEERLERNVTERSISILNLDSSTEYVGKVIATDGQNSTESRFTFSTKSSTTVYIGDVQLKSQEEVHEFGGKKYGKIQGSLVLGIDFETESDIVDLTPLYELSEITGSFEIQKTLISSLGDLENLKRVGLDLIIMNNPELKTIGNQGQFEEIGRMVMILSNAQLTSLQGLEMITELETLSLGTNASLQTLEGINGLKKLRSNLFIVNNHALLEISSLQSIEEIGHYLQITHNSVLPSLEGLHNVRLVGGGLSLYGLHELIDLSGLRSIEEVGLQIEIYENDKLTSIDTFHNLSAVNGNLLIYNCQNLTSIDGLQNIEKIDGDLWVYLNSKIGNVDGFSGLKHISGGLYLFQNDALSNLDGFTNLETVVLNFQITNNHNLSDLCGITTAVLNYPEYNYFVPQSNAYDPARQDFIDGNCSL